MDIENLVKYNTTRFECISIGEVFLHIGRPAMKIPGFKLSDGEREYTYNIVYLDTGCFGYEDDEYECEVVNAKLTLTAKH